MLDVSNPGSSRLKPKRAKGDNIEMHGGRIVRSAGRKDRHSKVCTARGPRDRRVRLSPNTAIQFYDVQDRLGYDRPSKAIDWLMKEAKAAIDALDHDSSNATTTNLDASTILMQPRNPLLPEKGLHVQEESTNNCSKSACGIDSQDYMNNDPTINNFSSFFSMDNGVIPPICSTGFHTYPHVGDLSASRNIKSQTQGLSLSFHTVQDFSFLFSTGQHGLITPASTPSHCDGESNSEMARCQRIFAWNSNSNNAKGSQESLVNSPPLNFPSTFDQNQLLFHREPLQSSFSPPIRGPLDSHFPNLCFSGTRFSNDVELSELSAAARTQGQEEQNPISSKPSSATSILHYQD